MVLAEEESTRVRRRLTLEGNLQNVSEVLATQGQRHGSATKALSAEGLRIKLLLAI